VYEGRPTKEISGAAEDIFAKTSSNVLDCAPRKSVAKTVILYSWYSDMTEVPSGSTIELSIWVLRYPSKPP